MSKTPDEMIALLADMALCDLEEVQEGLDIIIQAKQHESFLRKCRYEWEEKKEKASDTI